MGVSQYVLAKEAPWSNQRDRTFILQNFPPKANKAVTGAVIWSMLPGEPGLSLQRQQPGGRIR